MSLLYNVSYYRADGRPNADGAHDVPWRDSYISVGKGEYTCTVCTNGERDVTWYDPQGNEISALRLPWAPQMQLSVQLRAIFIDLDAGRLSPGTALPKIRAALEAHGGQSWPTT